MTQYTHVSSVPLSIAVFLATDNYDSESHTISATALIKPLRQSILASRIPPEDSYVSLPQMMASRIGSAIHDAIERSWLNNYKEALKAINTPSKVIQNILVNPTKDQLYEGCIPVYLEQRAYKTVGKHTVSGKFDFVIDGRVEDFKTTSVFSAMNGSSNENYRLQGSIYRWLNPEIITEDNMAIQFIFTDWSAAQAVASKNYPPLRFQERVLPLLSIKQTDSYVTTKLAQLDKFVDAAEEDLPYCTDEELWRSAPVYKYYKNPEKTARSTKNFDTKEEAYIYMAQANNVGTVILKPGQVKACKYCPAFSLCTQKDALIAVGDLTL